MLHLLKRHPFPVIAHFDWCLVLTYALPAEALAPLLPPGLTLDTYTHPVTGESHAFIACAFVQTTALRPAHFPAFLGQSFFLAGFRIFTRFKRRDGITLRGLKILRSLTNKPLMARTGNLLTHYNYGLANTRIQKSPSTLDIRVDALKFDISLDLTADLSASEAPLPETSVFKSHVESRKFQGPMPFTFDHEHQTNSIIVIKGTRQAWSPRPVFAQVRQNTFFDSLNLSHANPRLSSVFYIEHIPYRWERGIRHPLPSQPTPQSDDAQAIDDE